MTTYKVDEDLMAHVFKVYNSFRDELDRYVTMPPPEERPRIAGYLTIAYFITGGMFHRPGRLDVPKCTTCGQPGFPGKCLACGGTVEVTIRIGDEPKEDDDGRD